MYNEVAHGHSVMYKLKRENKMKQEFELTLDNNGRPCISFKHDERAKDLEQKVLKVFIDGANEKGIKLNRPSGGCNSRNESWSNYEILICT